MSINELQSQIDIIDKIINAINNPNNIDEILNLLVSYKIEIIRKINNIFLEMEDKYNGQQSDLRNNN